MYDFSFQFHAKAYSSNIKSSCYSKYSKTAKRLKEKFINDEKKFRYLNWFKYFLSRIKLFVNMKALPLLSKARLWNIVRKKWKVIFS